MKREDTYSVKVSVDGRDLGVWDKMEGGEIDSEETRYRPGGLAEEIPLGGTRTRGNITLSKLYDEGVHDVYHWLDSRAGRGSVVVTRQPLDPDGNAFGRPLVYVGTLKSVAPPAIDSESSDAALVEIEVVPRPGLA